VADHRRQYSACSLHAGYQRATNVHIGCVILFAFPQQQWLHERFPLLRYMHISSLVKTCFYYRICLASWQ